MTSLFVAWGLGLMGFARMGALRKASSGGGSPPSTAGELIWTFPLLTKAS